MSLFEVGRTQEAIAGEINAIKEQTYIIVLQAAIEIGKKLIEAKELVGHGDWGKWLAENVDYSQAKANDLMRVYREYGSNSQSLGNISFTKAVTLLGVAEDEREEFAKQVNIEEISTRELKEAVKEKQRIEREKQELEEQLKKEQQAHQESLEQMQMQLGEVQGQMAKAVQERGDNKQLEQELAVADSTIQQLQKELKAKPIDATVVQVVPEALQKELDALRAPKGPAASTDIVIFKFQFEVLMGEFEKTLVLLDQIKDADEHAKSKENMHKLLDRMRASIEEE